MPAVNDTVWSEQDTTPAAIESALRELLAERHKESDCYVPARVLNLVCIADREWSGEVANRLRRVGRYHPSRTIVCAVGRDRTRLNAVATVAATAHPEPGAFALTRETVIIDVGPQHLEHLDTIIDPLVVTDLPTVVWAPHGHWDAVEALRGLSQVVLLDSVDEPSVEVALRRAAELLEHRYVVDLAWLRSTPWRERIAAAFDPPARRPALRQISGLEVRHHDASGAAALLLCGWLASQLGWKPESLQSHGQGHAQGRLGDVSVKLDVARLDVPGLAGITIRTWDGGWLSLDRGSGGLRAVRHEARDGDREWIVLGASRGEGGILGEGIRQSLLRDPVYGAALRAAGKMLA
jgi:glucose-6-phosphate dehydrogenase assembly protein OpcA